MFRKITSVILTLSIIFSLTAMASATDTTTVTVKTTLDRANALKELGLFMGTDNGFDLDRSPTRTEAVVMLLRMLGEEKIAQQSSYTSPFTDVPTWAAKSIAYAYNKGYTSGTGKTTFGANDLTTPAQFITFMLRALSYSDKSGDFVWSASIQKAETLGIVASGNYAANGAFNRGDCVDIIYSVLGANKKDETNKLAETLIAKEAINGTIAAKYGFGKPITSPDALIDLSSKTYTNNERVSILSAKSLLSNDAYVRFEIAPTDKGVKATNVYLSEDGINYKVLKMTSSMDRSNSEVPYVHVSGNFYAILNLQFSTTYTVCFETSQNVFMTPVTFKTANAEAVSISGYGAPYGSRSTDGIYTLVEVGVNLSLEGNWSYQFYRWTPGSNPVAISGASGVANGSAVIYYEPTSEDLNSYVFWRVTNDDGVILENGGKYVDYITGMPVQ